jgi:hypothetical protein
MKTRPSTTFQGDRFRDSVKGLIELTPGCTNVQGEVQLGPRLLTFTTKSAPLSAACEWPASARIMDGGSPRS